MESLDIRRHHMHSEYFEVGNEGGTVEPGPNRETIGGGGYYGGTNSGKHI